MPTGWLITGAGAVLLASTAAFGGLAEVPTPKPPELSVGQHHVGAQLDMAVVGAALGDRVRGTGLIPAPGERTLLVVLDVTNEYDEARIATAKDALGGVAVEGVDLHRLDATRVADGSGVLFLQPDVPTRVQIAWTVPADAVRVGEEIRVTLPDATLFEGKLFVQGSYWEDYTVGAVVTVPVAAVPADREAS